MKWKIVLFMWLVGANAHATELAIVGATVFDATGAPPFAATIIIKNGLITSITTPDAVPTEMPVIEAKGLSLIPGLYDLHTHFTPRGQPGTEPQIMQAYISAGVTTVFNFHSAPEGFSVRRNWYQTLPGPRVKFVARMSTPGGHGAEWGDETMTRWVNTPFAAKQNVKDLIHTYRPDAIKAFADGWRYGSGINTTSMDEPTLAALVAQARAGDTPILTHTVTATRAAMAGRAGVNVIAHSTLDRELSNDEIESILQGGTAYAGTLAVYDPDKANRSLTPEQERKLRAMFATGLRNMKALHNAGVPVVLGTDAGMPGTPHGVSTLRELELMVSAGLTPAEALIAATAQSAAAVGEADTRGTIETGKAADFVLVAGKPWQDISHTRNTVHTFVDGKHMYGKGGPEAVTITQMESVQIDGAVIDDFDRQDGRTSRNTMRMADFDQGKARSRQVMHLRHDGTKRGQVLHLSGEFVDRKEPYVGVILPLNKASIQAADVNSWKGIQADLRGKNGSIELIATTRDGTWHKELSVDSSWKTLQVPFSTLNKSEEDAQWVGNHLFDIRFRAKGHGRETVWLEIDQVQLF